MASGMLELVWLVVAWGGTPMAAVGGHALPIGDTSDGDATELLGPRRIAALAPTERAAWQRYIETSDGLRARDRASMDAELRASGQTTMRPGPYLRAFRMGPEMTETWFRGDNARRAADNMLTFQTPSGGWSKRVDTTTRPRAPGESYCSEGAKWTYIPTFDNDATTEQIRFLAAAQVGHPDSRYRDAAIRGIEYLFAAQFPNGCWPQGFPLQGGYHDAATFNDNVIVNVLHLLSDVADGKIAFVPAETRSRATSAVSRGVVCILDAQVMVGGVRTVWGQQHDPLTLLPTRARSYEPAGLSGRESALTTRFLMELPAPNERVVTAVVAAVAWFRAHQIHGWDYKTYELKQVPGAGPLWARLIEIETGRPIFSNRDGVKLYDWNLLTDRRQGYAWFGKEPAKVIDRYATWAAGKPHTAGSPNPGTPQLPENH